MQHKYFVIDLSYVRPLEVVDQYKDQHMSFLKEYYDKNIFICSGPKSPRTGGIIFAKSFLLAELEQILNNDPFKIEKIAEYKITEFSPAMFSEDFRSCIT